MTAPVSQRPRQELLRLVPGVSLARTSAGDHYLLAGQASCALGRLRPSQQSLLRRLAGEPCTAAELWAAAGGQSAADLDAHDNLIVLLLAGGWLSAQTVHGGRPLYTVVPRRRRPDPPTGPPPPSLVLSRFALIHRDAGRLLVSSPRAWCDLEIHDPAVLGMLGGLMPSLRAGRPPESLSGDLPEPVARQLLRDLWWAGVAVPPTSAEDSELAVGQWASHELWFHDRSRISRRAPAGGFGATWWARGRFDPLPARREPVAGPAIDLYRPDLAALRAGDPSLTEVLEERRSIREHDDARPVTRDQLGELLYRCARNRQSYHVDGVEYVSRPYPAGGGAYELELYPVVRQLAGLAAGMYHYDPRDHRLAPVNAPAVAVRRLLNDAAVSAGTASPPQVLIVIAARFGRVMWKYEAMAYALTLKHVGVLYQTMYQVATAMGLAACGLGAGSSALFADATGLDPATEGSVGEFMLGSRPDLAGGEAPR